MLHADDASERASQSEQKRLVRNPRNGGWKVSIVVFFVGGEVLLFLIFKVIRNDSKLHGGEKERAGNPFHCAIEYRKQLF